MYEFYSTWNFTWFFLRFTSPEKCREIMKCADKALFVSILNTCLFGGFMTYVYPRKVRFKLRNTIYNLNFGLKLIMSDLMFHQIPMYISYYYKIYQNGSMIYLVPVITSYRFYVYKFCNNSPPYKLSEKFAYIIPIGCGLVELYKRKQQLKIM